MRPVADPRVAAAFEAVPRIGFLPAHQRRFAGDLAHEGGAPTGEFDAATEWDRWPADGIGLDRQLRHVVTIGPDAPFVRDPSPHRPRTGTGTRW